MGPPDNPKHDWVIVGNGKYCRVCLEFVQPGKFPERKCRTQTTQSPTPKDRP